MIAAALVGLLALGASTSHAAEVVCFGDSITKRGYPQILARVLGVDVVNAGIAGHTSAQGLRRMEIDVLAHRPEVVVIFFGTNDTRVDSKVYVPLDRYRKNLEEMVANCRKIGAQVVLCTPPPINQKAYFKRHEKAVFDANGGLSKLLTDYRGAVKAVGKAHDVPVVDLAMLLEKQPNWMHSDGVHPSKDGNAFIANHLAQAVRPLLKQSTREKAEVREAVEPKPKLQTTKLFIHPGLLNSRDELAFIKQKIATGEEPWKSAWEKLQATEEASLDYTPKPLAKVVRGVRNRPDIGSSDMSDDSTAAYAHAVQWCLTRKQAYATKAIEILNAWSGTLESVSGHDARLLIGMDGIKFCNAAELIRHTGAGWLADDQKRFERMLRKVFYPVIENFYPTANGNWDASMIQTMLAMGVFLDDRAMFDRAVDYFLQGEGNGAIEKYLNDFGECQESGRDQSHVQMGIGYLSCACEIAWKQGVDLYGAADNRLALGFEYTAKYNLGEDVRYEPYLSVEGRYDYARISRRGRGRFRPIYELIVHHYHHRKGFEMSHCRKVADGIRPEGTHDQHMPWGTLMFYGLPKGDPN